MSTDPSFPLPNPFGRYQILSRLGQGGMGSVYLAEDTQLGRRVALKVPDFGPADREEASKRFLKEARTAATLDHPYLCPVYDVGEIDGRLYLTMAYIEGKSLAQTLRAEGMPARQVAALVGKLALALQEAHDRGIIHRDLKPANVMIKSVGARREPVIVDFGLAHRDDAEEARLTKTGQVMGTLAYMAPEQIRGDLAEMGPGCDIYALGVILYELLTGRMPFRGSGIAIAGQILTQEPLPLTDHRADIDLRLQDICRKAMAKKVSDRYTSMKDLAGALSEYLKGTAETAPSASATPPSTADLSDSPSRTTGGSSLVNQLLKDPASEIDGAAKSDSLGRKLPRLVAIMMANGVKTIAVVVMVVLAVVLVVVNLPAMKDEVANLSPSKSSNSPGSKRQAKTRPASDTTDPVNESVTSIFQSKSPFGGAPPQRKKATVADIPSKAVSKTRPGEFNPARIRGFGEPRESSAPGLGLLGQHRDGPTTKANSAQPAQATHPISGKWVPLFNGQDLHDWSAYGRRGAMSLPDMNEIWSVNNGVLQGKGADSALYASRDDYTHFRLRAEVKINDGGLASIGFLSPKSGVQGTRGYEVRINSSNRDIHKTGSLYRPDSGLLAVEKSLVPPDTWCVIEVEVNDGHVKTTVDGTLCIDWVEAGVRKTATKVRGHIGGIAIKLQNASTVLQVRKLEIMEPD